MITKEELEKRKKLYEEALESAKYQIYKAERKADEQRDAVKDFEAGLDVVNDMLKGIEFEERKAKLREQQEAANKAAKNNE